MKRFSLLALVGAMPLAASAQLFSDNFDADHTANWNYYSSITGDGPGEDTGNAADFSFDYSTVGIPSAPNSVGGTTRGLKMQANVPGTNAAPLAGMSVSPIGQRFTGDYTLRFDAWLNFNGPAPAGGNGSTQMMLAGVGGTTSKIQFAGSNIDGIGFAGSGDGGTSTDYRLYNVSMGTGVNEGDSAFAAGSRNNTNAYYTSRFQGAIPAAQTALYPQQTGAPQAGALGFAWRRWEIKRVGGTTTWSVDGSLIATATGKTPVGDNIFLGFFDINGTSSTDANARKLLFGVVDNVQVVPEPASMVALGLGAAAMLRRRKKG